MKSPVVVALIVPLNFLVPYSSSRTKAAQKSPFGVRCVFHSRDTALDPCDTEDFAPVVKLFSPCDAAYVSLNEIRSIRLPFGLYIERDIHFAARAKLSVYTLAARIKGRITQYSEDLKAAVVVEESPEEKEFNR